MKRVFGIGIVMLAVLLAVGLGIPKALAAPEQAVPVAPTTEVYLNPLYTEQVMPKLQTAKVSAAEAADTYYTTVEDAAGFLREQMVNREAVIVFEYRTQIDQDGLMRSILDEAMVHTGDPRQGDYLRWQYGGCNMIQSGYIRNGVYYLTLTYEMSYYTTAEQEQLVDSRIQQLLEQLDVEEARDYDKVKAIYDYICRNVTYDYEGLNQGDSTLIYTAYAALINGTSVCQGYANLFYRLALELGVDARLIAGIGNGGDHAWNIVKLGGKYYNLDATWDAVYSQAGLDYQYFLRCEATFEDHFPGEDYSTAEFASAYPMADADYKPDWKPVIGDFNGDELVTDGDALYLLRFTLFPDRYPISGDGDVNSDGSITDGDALYLLRFTLFADRYPLYPKAQ